MKTLRYVEMAGGRCFLTTDTVHQVWHQHGRGHVAKVQPATTGNVEWVRKQGGDVPEGRIVDDLTRQQRELLAAMQSGVKVGHVSGIDAYYYRDDNYRRCTVAAYALVSKGYAEKIMRPGTLTLVDGIRLKGGV